MENQASKKPEPHVNVVGDTAQLISGGPKMTVAKVIVAAPAPPNIPGTMPVDASLHCWWFSDKDGDKNILHKAEFPPEVLVVTAKS